MSLGDRGWRDSTENYCDSYLIQLAGTTATAIQGNDYKQPIVLFGMAFEPGEAVTTGDISLIDGSATADSGDTRKWRMTISSGTVSHPEHEVMFSRGLAFDTGIIVSATTVTGALNLLIKQRYS